MGVEPTLYPGMSRAEQQSQMSKDQSATRSSIVGVLGTALLAASATTCLASDLERTTQKVSPLKQVASTKQVSVSKAKIAIDGSRGQSAALSAKDLRTLVAGDRLTFRPPNALDGTSRGVMSFQVEWVRTLGQGRYAFSLKGVTNPFHHAQFVVRNGVIAGALHSGQDYWWRLLSDDVRTVSIEAVNSQELPPCGGVELPPEEEGGEEGPGIGGLAHAGAEVCSGTCSERTIDMALFYTQLALGGAGSVGQMEAICELDVLQANIGFENSDSETRVRIVYIGPVEYDDYNETGHLGNFSNSTDGKMDAVQPIMTVTGADVGSLIVEYGEGYCGVAYLGPARYHVNVRACMGGFVLAHELGHNLGACHACGDGGGCSCGGYLPHSVGWRFTGDTGQEWRTIMAYSPGFRLPNFSNPEVLHDGQPTGVPVGETNEADNVATFFDTTPLVSAFACPPAVVQTVKMTPTDAAQFDLFGQSTAVSDGRVIVGAYLADEAATDSGGSYVFSQVDSSSDPCPTDPYGLGLNQCFIQSAKPPVFGTRRNDGVGRSTAAKDGWMVTGAPLRDTMTTDKDGEEVIDQEQVGSAFVYQRTGDTWCFIQELFTGTPLAEDRFGTAVAMDGDTIVVGIPRLDVAGDELAGAFECFQRTGSVSEPWVSSGVIAGDPTDFGSEARFGSAVAVDGNYLAVGAPYARGENGLVHIYEFSGSSWSFFQELEPPVGILEEVRFGSAIALSGDSLLIGAPQADDNDGRAYMYTFDGTTWSLQQTFTPLGGENESQFGASVALDENYGLIGAPRSPSPTEDISETGAVFMVKRVEVNWYMVAILTAFDAEEGDQYGVSVAIEGELLAVGAAYDNDNGIQSGSVYVHPFLPLVDCNRNGYGDRLEILQGIALDNNENGVPDPCDCVGDMNFDGLVDGADLTFVLTSWDETGTNLRPDINLDGIVNGADLTILLGTWGECPEL